MNGFLKLPSRYKMCILAVFRYMFLSFSTGRVLATRKTSPLLCSLLIWSVVCDPQERNASATALRWFASDTGHFVFIHTTSVVETVHFQKQASKSLSFTGLSSQRLFIMFVFRYMFSAFTTTSKIVFVTKTWCIKLKKLILPFLHLK